MTNTLVDFLQTLDNILWGYGALPALIALGLCLTYKSRFAQIRRFPVVVRTFINFLSKRSPKEDGVHPLKAFFTCIGGSMGIGNVVAICTAVQIGGPGALFWVWATATLGMIIKYSEVFLGLRYRQSDGKGGFRGGPMYFLKKVYKTNRLPTLTCILLCFYGIEIYQFSVVTDSLSTNLNLNKMWIAPILLLLVIGVGRGGIRIVGRVGATLIPVFLLTYLLLALWVFYANLELIPQVLMTIFYSAFNGHAAVGAFAGSGVLLAASQGIRRSCYSGDVGVGYASVIHSQTRENQPERQASLAIFEIFLDSFLICTTSVMLVMLTGVWNQHISAPLLVQTALATQFPYMDIFMPLFFLCLGYTTILTYFSAGIKCAEFLLNRRGRVLFVFIASIALPAFTLLDTTHALTVMSINGALLLIINVYGIYKLRHEISFSITLPQPPIKPVQAALRPDSRSTFDIESPTLGEG